MLLLGISHRWAVQRALRLALFFAAVALARTQTLDYSGTLPEDYLPGLKPILQSALQQSPQMLLQSASIAATEARVYEADSQRWPNLGGNIRYDSNDTAISGNSATQSRDSGLFYSTTLNQAIFHWGEIKHQGDMARIEVAVAQKNYADGYRILANTIRQSYLDLIARKAQLAQAQYSLSLDQAALASLRERLATGNVSPADVSGRELQVNETQLAVDRMQADFDGYKLQLAHLAGLKEIKTEDIPSEIPAPRYDATLTTQLLAAMLRDGAKSTFQAQVAELNIKEADLRYRVARVRLLPKFDASLAYSRESSTTATPTSISQTAITRDTIEVRGNWNIFDGWATKGAKLEAKADRRVWERRRQMATESAMDEAQRLARRLGLDARAMQFAQIHRDAQAGFLTVRENDMKSGRVSQAEVDGARLALRSAEANAASSRATFLSDWSSFVSLAASDPILNNLPTRYVRPAP